MSRILFLSRSNEHGGGASKAAALLASELVSRGVNLTYWMLEGTPTEAWQMSAGSFARGVSILHRLCRRSVGQPWLPFEIALLPRGKWDVVHLHDTWLTISPSALWLISKRQPTYITFQDCSMLLGGCMYPWGCTRIGKCGCCPQKEYENIAIDITTINLRVKQRLLKHSAIRTIAPSAWMAGIAAAGAVFPNSAKVIPNACDTRVFRPQRRDAARKRWGLSESVPTVLISAASLADPRKNVAGAVRVLGRFRNLPLQLLVAGRPAKLGLCDAWSAHFLGYIQAAEMADAMAAADVFLFPSLQDNCPLAVIESLACGTPVIAYHDSGGTPELLLPGYNALLARYNDEDDLSEKLRVVLSSFGAWREKRQAIARDAEIRFAVSRCADEHLALYEGVGVRGR